MGTFVHTYIKTIYLQLIVQVKKHWLGTPTVYSKRNVTINMIYHNIMTEIYDSKKRERLNRKNMFLYVLYVF